MSDDLVEVTQAGREFVIQSGHPIAQLGREAILKGEWDHHYLVQAFARYRQQSTTETAALKERLARADLSQTLYARALEKIRIALVNVHDGLEDEGDRIYLGSTNHADDLRAAWQLADGLRWDEIMEDMQPKTELAEVNLRLQAENAILKGALADTVSTNTENCRQRDALQERLREVEELLRPFAFVADMEKKASVGESVMVNVERCRDARAYLAKHKEQGDAKR